MKRLLLLPLVLCIGCGGSSNEAKTPEPAAQTEDFAVSARAATNKLQITLKGELQAAMKAGGPANAIDVCSRRANAIAQEVSQDTGLEVRRVSDRTRNPENKAQYWHQVILERFRAAPALKDTVFSVQGKPVLMKPIRINSPVCLQCHGDAASLAPEVAAKIQEIYPDDQATGFDDGDLRGAFVVR